ncbi:MAG: hypothetical protein HY815_13995, partial [Candidatus Riflebacteria bacterium]|nr:hypothetical protein [Candidatus Riflebacteria bacterium]
RATVARVLGQLSARHPEPDLAPAAGAVLLDRAQTLHVTLLLKIDWARQVVAMVEEIKKEEGDVALGFGQQAARIDRMAYDPASFLHVARWAKTVPAALRRVTSVDSSGEPWAGQILADVQRIAAHFALIGYRGATRKQFEERVTAFDRELAALDGPFGALAGKAARGVWLLGRRVPGKSAEGPFRELCGDLEQLRASCPGSSKELARLEERLSRDLFGQPRRDASPDPEPGPRR